jgi:hypothetical protein
MPSPQVAGRHFKLPVPSSLQLRLVQSAPILHFLPFSQGPQLPPQSVSVSSPSNAVSLQLGTLQMLKMQSMFATVGSQSALILQAEPWGQ